MKVRYVRASIINPDKEIVNSDMSEYLPVGSIFWVYGISFSHGITYLYIFNENHLFEVPLQLFEIIDNSVSALWTFKLRENGDVTLWPELFYRAGFLENLAEREGGERKEF